MITRDNYEEFFLLYTDNELSAAEKQDVERFVADHPDLREEWEALLQCRLTADTRLTFPDRNSLLRPDAESSVYTDDLISYMDGELDAIEQERIETALRERPPVARELATLRQTISHPDLAIVFAEKDRLYRPAKDRRIIPLPWLRAGIAAAVVAAVALVWLLPAGQKHPQPALSPAPAASPAAAVSPAAAHKFISPVTPEPVAALHYTEGRPKQKQPGPAKQTMQKQQQQAQDRTLNDITGSHRTVTRATITPARPTQETNVTPAISVPNTRPAGDLATNVRFAVQTVIPKEQSSFATQALQQEEANDQRSNNFITDEPAAPVRTKLRGIFRKVTRAFGKTADRDNDGNRQLWVGAFQVSLN
jgi:anti-sigma factor RsiW